MLSRALSLATVTLLIGCGAAAPAWAQATNLEAGKSPSQIFAGTCTACHKGPRGLLRTVAPGSLQGFLRQHYTTSPEMATLLAGFLVSNGAADTRYAQPKEGKDGKTEARGSNAPEQVDRFGRKLHPGPQEATKPEGEPHEAAKPDAEHGRRRLARPGEEPATEAGPDGRKLTAKQRLGKRGKPGAEEPPKSETAKTESSGDEPKGEAAKEDTPLETKSDTAKVDAGKPEAAKPAGEGKSESAKIETPGEMPGGETPTARPDPVPSVTPAPAASPTVSAAVSSGTTQPATGASPPVPAQPEAPPVTASAPPVAPAGAPAPPISQ